MNKTFELITILRKFPAPRRNRLRLRQSSTLTLTSDVDDSSVVSTPPSYLFEGAKRDSYLLGFWLQFTDSGGPITLEVRRF